MRRFIGALIFGVIVVIFMLVQWNKEQRQHSPEPYLQSPVEGEMHNGEANEENDTRGR